MSTLIVEVCKINDISKHGNADAMEIASVKGWDCCVKKGQFKIGDLCVYFPPDSILPVELSDKLGVTKYLSNGRVRVANLRGFKSYGLIMPLEEDIPLGTDVTEKYGITKYEPPVEATQGDADREFQLFHKYYDMENIRNFPDLLIESDEVYITEKIHGQNARIGYVFTPDGMRWCAGSHSVNRKEFTPEGKRSRYWELITDNIRSLVEYIGGNHSVVIFGELFGSGIQDMTYGYQNGKTSFRVFDMTINGQYVSYNVKEQLLINHGISTVPLLYKGPFKMDVVKELTDGKSYVDNTTIREGVVINTIVEQQRSTPTRHFSRCMLKSISFDYLNRKGGTEYH